MRVLAIDLGATSIRVASVDLDATPIEPGIIHRWSHQPVRHPDGSLRWDWQGIVREVRHGLDLALAQGPAFSIGIDGWGVDYGLIDTKGDLLSQPFSYRDSRTQNWKMTAARVGEQELYRKTGTQLTAINTIFQLAAHDPDELATADLLLLLPDLMIHELTGHVGAERSNASTTGLLDIASGTWSHDLCDAMGLPRRLLPAIHEATTEVGHYRGVPVHLVGSHDTASAVIALPGIPSPTSAFVSSGTWILVGTERAHPDTSEEARLGNFTNEAGALGGVRFLKNVIGFWMLEECRRSWGNPPLDTLISEAEAVTTDVPIIDAGSERFLSPLDMEKEIRTVSGLSDRATRGEVVRCILESIAQTTATVVTELGSLTGTPIGELQLIGGGVRISLMNHLYTHHSGLPARLGSVEAAALGNSLTQGIALGRYTGVQEAREQLRPLTTLRIEP